MSEHGDDNDSDDEYDPKTELFDAAARGDIDEFRAYLSQPHLQQEIDDAEERFEPGHRDHARRHAAWFQRGREQVFQTAITHGQFEMVAFLFTDPHMVSRAPNALAFALPAALREVVQEGDVELLELLLASQLYRALECRQQMADTNDEYFELDYLLSLAARSESAAMAQTLLAHGARINNFAMNEMTPLHSACANPSDMNDDCVKLLLDAGADVNAVDYLGSVFWGDTPLQKLVCDGAWSHDHVAVAQRLVEHGADVNLVNTRGSSLLHMAAVRGQTDIVEFLLQHGANVDAENARGETPLLLACDCYQGFQFSVGDDDSQASVAEVLVTYHADVNHASPTGRTALHAAASNEFVSVASFLLEHGADVHAMEVATGNTPLHAAVFSWNSPRRTLEQMLERGADPNAENVDGWTPGDVLRQQAGWWGQEDNQELVQRLETVYGYIPRTTLPPPSLVADAPINDGFDEFADLFE